MNRPDFKYYIFIFLAAVLPVVWACSGTGPGMTHDSREYLFAAEHFYNTGTLSRMHGVPYNCWPPLYPMFLSFLVFFTENTDTAITVLQSLLHGACSILVFGIFQTIHSNRTSTAIFTLMYAWGISPVICNYFVWSESLFLFFQALLLFFLIRLPANKLIKTLLVAIVCSLCIMTRYAGAVFIPVCAILIYIKNSPGQRLRHLTLLMSVTCGTLLMWMLRNYLMYGIMDEYRPHAQDGAFIENFVNLCYTAAGWFAPVGLLPKAISALAVAIAVVWIGYRSIKLRVSIPAPELLMAGFYFIFIYVTTSVYLLDPIDDRLAAPLYLPLLIAIFRKLHAQEMLRRKTVLALLCIPLAYGSVRTGYNIMRWNRTGVFKAACNSTFFYSKDDICHT